MDEWFWVQIGSAAGLVVFGTILGLSKSFFDWLKQRRAAKTHAIHIRQFHEIGAIDLSIHALLTSCRISQHATRVTLLRYHNGDYYIDGSPIQKLTCTHESVAPGTAHMMMEGSPASQFAVGLSHLVKKQSEIIAIKNLPDCRFRRLLESMGTVVVAGVPVMIGEHQMAGVMVVAWDEVLKRSTASFAEVAEQTAREIGNEIVRMQASMGK